VSFKKKIFNNLEIHNLISAKAKLGDEDEDRATPVPDRFIGS
jgi:hypothetical protein